MRAMSSTNPVSPPTVIRSPRRSGCVNETRRPEPRLESGVLKARPAKSASTALDASSAFAMSAVTS